MTDTTGEEKQHTFLLETSTLIFQKLKRVGTIPFLGMKSANAGILGGASRSGIKDWLTRVGVWTVITFTQNGMSSRRCSKLG